MLLQSLAVRTPSCQPARGPLYRTSLGDGGIETTRAWSGKLGKPMVLDGDITSANHSLVKDGWCWWYRKYAPGDTVLAGLEKEAREAKKGLWVDPAPVPPWGYRKARRGQSLDLSDLVPLETETE